MKSLRPLPVNRSQTMTCVIVGFQKDRCILQLLNCRGRGRIDKVGRGGHCSRVER